MKYGQTFQAQSVPQWAPYNVDYNELKNLIKVHTTRDSAQAIAIPGQADSALHRFEELFFNELSNQHDRVDLFVRSKSDEISRRLQFLQKSVLRLLARCTISNGNGKAMSLKRRERFAKYDTQVERCGEDIRALQRFVAAQRMAFHKILKKYKKWTGSRALGERFNDEILNDPKSFARRDFQPLLAQYNDLLTNLRASTPDASGPATPTSSRRGSRRPSTHTAVVPSTPQTYWNEYDDGSEAENEPYTIYINPEAGNFPGSKTIASIFHGAKKPVEKVRGWFSPSASPAERRPLLTHENSYFNERQSLIDTDIDEEAETSSTEYPSGYRTHYATFPSVSDQKLSRNREQLLFHVMLGCFGVSLILLLIAGLLVATGKKKLRAEVDAGVVVGVLASLLSNMFGIGSMLYRRETLGWIHRICVGTTFVAVCVLNGMLLVLVASTVTP